jgi:DNA-binding transcriptional ArsR family regulator
LGIGISLLHMNAISNDLHSIKEELSDQRLLEHCETCAKRYAATGDPTAMRVCYLLCHHPKLSVTEAAQLLGISVSAASRCLKKLYHGDVVCFCKEAQVMYYSLADNGFTKVLKGQLLAHSH